MTKKLTETEFKVLEDIFRADNGKDMPEQINHKTAVQLIMKGHNIAKVYDTLMDTIGWEMNEHGLTSERAEQELIAFFSLLKSKLT
jgi:hypothetical protein